MGKEKGETVEPIVAFAAFLIAHFSFQFWRNKFWRNR